MEGGGCGAVYAGVLFQKMLLRTALSTSTGNLVFRKFYYLRIIDEGKRGNVYVLREGCRVVNAAQLVVILPFFVNKYF